MDKNITYRVVVALSLFILFAGTPLIASAQSYPGLIHASRNTQLAFRVGGPLTRVAVSPGEVVTKGQVLMQIDPRDFKDNIRVLEAQLGGARAQKVLAEQNFDRAQTLFEQHVSSNADFDRAKSHFDASYAGVHSLEAQLRIARHQLQDTTLVAPYAGVIIRQPIENHEMVKPGTVVLAMQNISVLEVEIALPESEMIAHPLKKGEQVEVRLSSQPDKMFTAQLKEWSTVADRITRTYALRFSFSAPEQLQVLPGMTADVHLVKWTGSL
ncbi:MAG: efflux RND transporter periplasmic adaptor subunit [Thermodesulfobacteriota bacterium]|nr:efflux RND transporter periplasmic adaptor subunit [Thermodesulfobacteriota bacterium]